MLLLALIGVGWLAAMVMCVAICAAVKRIDTEIAIERALTGSGDVSGSGFRRPAGADPVTRGCLPD
jgi:hypothetical protein